MPHAREHTRGTNDENKEFGKGDACGMRDGVSSLRLLKEFSCQDRAPSFVRLKSRTG